MKEYGLVGVSKAKGPSYKKVKPERDNACDLVNRDFSVSGSNQVWFANITYVRTYQGWLYLVVVFDIGSRIIVGRAMGSEMDAAMVDDALRMGIARRNPPSGLIYHSDHGRQYRSTLLGKTMRAFGIVPPMGSIVSPWDNAVAESLMSTIKAECIDNQTYETRDIARLEIFDYIERFYSRVRLHSGIGYMSPAEYENKMLESALSA